MPDDWITTAEAMRLSGYTRKHVTRLAQSGRVIARRFGPLWQVNKQSLLSYMKSAQELGEKRGPKGSG